MADSEKAVKAPAKKAVKKAVKKAAVKSEAKAPVDAPVKKVAAKKSETVAVKNAATKKAEPVAAKKAVPVAPKKTSKALLRVTLIKSKNGRLASHKASVAGLGLRRMHQTVEVIDTPENRGMINRVQYLLNVEEV